MPPRNAARSMGAGAGDGSGQRVKSTALPPCWCGGSGTASVEGRVLNGLAILTVPVCNNHIPSTAAGAERLIALTLLAIADGVAEADLGVRSRGRRRCRHG